MYGGPPPMQQPGSLPPFPPTFNPNAQPPPGGFPPFRPPQGFIPPPFSSSFPPGASSSPNGANGFRPPVTPGMYPPRPAHPGLGLPPLPGGLPGNPHITGVLTNPPPSSAPPGFVRDVKTTSVFVGSIATGIGDQTLVDLLNACGPLHELKRVSGGSGKPQAFGFALFESPEVVMRCIRCLNGVELPDMTPEGARDRKPPKPLVVKVDDKTREFLEEFEQTLGRSEDDEATDAICRKAITHIVALLTDPNAPPPPDLPVRARSPVQVVVPAHLQDLREGDLPEEQRVVVLDQIAIFRENAARREREKKIMEDEKERFKAMEARNAAGSSGTRAPPSNTEGYGYGNRALARGQQAPQRQWGAPQQRSPQQQSPQQNGGGPGRKSSRDPQGYAEPVAFVRPQTAEAKGESERTDEEEEDMRRQLRDRERDEALRDRERRVENREQQRIGALNREMAHRKQQQDLEERNRKHLLETLADWDDDEKIERGRDLFFSDRTRWRTQRQAARTREYQDDVRDRQLEEDEVKALEQESEEFLKRQMIEMAELEETQKQAGLLTEDAAPIKLAINPPVFPEVKKEEKPDLAGSRHRPGINFDGDEEEEDPAKKKKRTLVKLEYEGDGLTEAEKVAKRNARLLEIRAQIPRERKRLWSMDIEWAAINESLIRDKLRPFVHEKMTGFLGEVDEDLGDFVIEHVRGKKGPDELVDGLEPVLAEEALTYVVQLWRQLTFESIAYVAGLETGTMMV